MTAGFSKTVFISYAPEDVQIAMQLKEVLQLIGPQVWIRDIDLKAGHSCPN